MDYKWIPNMEKRMDIRSSRPLGSSCHKQRLPCHWCDYWVGGMGYENCDSGSGTEACNKF
jgi:hypothetical protein